MGSVLYLHPHQRRAGARPLRAAQRETAPAVQQRRAPQSLLRLGYNCCAIARAERAALLIDAASYFRAFHDAALRAQRSITVLAWDFNSQTRLHFDPVPKDGPPAILGDFLNYLVKRRRGLHINVLNWDYPMVFGTDREFPPLYGFGWTPERRVHLRYDDTHPIAGCHHQKVAVIDDAVAFVGGIDLTVRRWDTPEHLGDDPRRTASGKPYPPFHDLMLAVDGDAARALAALARERWLAATGRRLPAAPPRGEDPWPEALEPHFTRVDVGIARTFPPRGEAPAVREVENLYLDMIASARRSIYIENQYFTAPRIAAALEQRLAEPDGPEVVLVLRLLSHGWLEEHTMHILRTRLLRRLQAADRHGRFRAYYPHVPGLASGCCLDVHSKLMIVDDACLRVGSANLCNRSMAVDAECDVAIESRGDPRIAGTIRELRDRLLAEHAGLAPEAFARRLAEAGSLHQAIAALPADGRALLPFKDVPEWPEAIVSVAAVADPDEPISLDALMAERALEEEACGARPAWGKIAAAFAAIAALAALWRFTPVAHVLTPANVIEWAQDFASSWWAPLVVMAAYTPACFVMFPRPLITLAGVIAFGAWQGFAYAVAGVVASAVVTYYVGRAMKRDTVRRLAGRKLDRMVDVLKKHGFLAMTLLRLVPIAPFAIEGIVAGAVRLKLWQLAAGTALGMLPGTLAATIFGDQLESALTGGGDINWWIVSAVAAAFVAGIVAVRRWFNRMARRLTADAARTQPR
ncbi:MAG TPA: VTT domain-containing protein [Burkholderiales bacterium]|nr:VTT domain-containing protein [Burkholderiales bacterium]